MNAEVAAAVLLIAVPIAFNVAFFELGRAFDYPSILRKEPAEILRRFAAGGSGLVLRWEALLVSALAMLPLVALLAVVLAAPPALTALSIVIGAAAALVQALGLVGARATVVAPPTLLPPGIDALGCETSTDISAISAADVVYVLRMQRERMEEAYVPSLREYTALYGITPERVRPGQAVMHPGPMNRGVEIDPRVADSDAALVIDQVRAGLAVRMAVLYDVLTVAPVAPVARGVAEAVA